MLLAASAALKTLVILTAIRDQMRLRPGLQALIVPNNGPHYIVQADCERRIHAISGFTGSAASVIVTLDYALLWTDGRYFVQAEQELDNNWILMKQGVPGYPSEAEWLLGNLTMDGGDAPQVGVDETLYPQTSWEIMVVALGSKITLVDTVDNLVDLALAASDETPLPPCPNEPILQLGIEFTGRTVADKLEQIRGKMREDGSPLLLVSELDDIAWLFNLRGSDMPPMFYAFAVVQDDSATLIVKNIDDAIVADLSTAGVHVDRNYHNAYETIRELMDGVTNVWVSKYASHHLALMAPDPKIIKLSPIALPKAIKNHVEVEGMKRANLRDSAAVVTFLSWLEKKIVDEGVTGITEISAANEILRIRTLEDGGYFVMPSFSTISAFAKNAAIIHYGVTEETNAHIAKDYIYLVDSGGHYKDGTTDITRTIFLGAEPRDDHKDRFTRVLKGHIAMATSVFPNKTTGNRLDSFARQFLWDVNLDYGHGTGHGIGMYMAVNEPQRIGVKAEVDDPGLQENMFMSNEPGYYKTDDYGIRIENGVRVSTANNL